MLNFYDVYDLKGNLIYENKKLSEVSDLLGVSKNSIYSSYFQSYVLAGKYIIKLNRKNERHEDFEKLCEDWDETVSELKSKFGNNLKRIKIVLGN